MSDEGDRLEMVCEGLLSVGVSALFGAAGWFMPDSGWVQALAIGPAIVSGSCLRHGVWTLYRAYRPRPAVDAVD
jgi:hypothetical protein